MRQIHLYILIFESEKFSSEFERFSMDSFVRFYSILRFENKKTFGCMRLRRRHSQLTQALSRHASMLSDYARFGMWCATRDRQLLHVHNRKWLFVRVEIRIWRRHVF